MLVPILNNFSTLIVTVRRNVWSSVLTTVLILTIILAWSARDVISDIVTQNPNPGLHSEAQLDSALRSDLFETNADRVLVRYFTEKEVDGKLVPWVSTLTVVTAPGIAAPTLLVLRESPRSAIGQVMSRMMADPKHPICVHLKTSELADSDYSNGLRQVGVMEQFWCPIEDINGNVVGFIAASYLTETKPKPDEQVIFQMLRETGSRLGGYLPKQQQPTWFEGLFN